MAQHITRFLPIRLLSSASSLVQPPSLPAIVTITSKHACFFLPLFPPPIQFSPISPGRPTSLANRVIPFRSIYTSIPHHSSELTNYYPGCFHSSLGGWKPQISSVFWDLDGDDLPCSRQKNVKSRWLVTINNFYHEELDTEQKLFEFYVEALATVVGSEEEARRKIYLVSDFSCPSFGFGAEIDEVTAKKLLGQPSLGVMCVKKDCYYDTRMKVLQGEFIPHRLCSIFSYYHLSESDSEWNRDHWLVTIKHPDGEFATMRRCIDVYTQVLARVLGSKSQALHQIYIVWCKLPFGFAAEIDQETANNLKGMPDVLTVLPDRAFDVHPHNGFTEIHNMNKFLIYPSYPGTRFTFSHLAVENDSVHPVDPNSVVTECTRMSHCNHWFITMEKPGGEFCSLQYVIDWCIETLAAAVGSEEEAKKKIYRTKCDSRAFGFGAEIDENTSCKLKVLSNVLEVSPDHLFYKSGKGGILHINKQVVQRYLRELRVDLRDWRIEHQTYLKHTSTEI